MPPKKPRSSWSPALKAFGNALRKFREELGWTQEQVGAKVPISGSYIGQVELGKTRCRREVALSLDAILGAKGVLVTLWDDLVMDAAYPTWFDWPTIEAQAAHLQTYQCLVVYGLLQTPEYARALLGDEESVHARMARQEILTRDDPSPPRLTVIMYEGVLHNLVGSKEIMREQLAKLLDAMSSRVVIQIVPTRIPLAGTAGSFVIATLRDTTKVAYAETAARGFTLGDPEDVLSLEESFDDIRAAALPSDMSADLIRKVMEERWT
ncbi:XRE family transcriptional regulator [Actinomadura craniellae]|uniref:XRE family transcriptional regulator n=1 Tax=Actinomadura craniellae TaxID=2231787 RepID=A0A365H3G4_9ACTN|nr:helix-turn-helix transcriptional regulator [Actinomadura craniellae]RAY13532.1 XRE family transcriptional regulator [Actinomadura craniellae]